MQKELDYLEERVAKLITLNSNLRSVNNKLASQLKEKLDECETLQKKINLSVTSLKRIEKKYFDA